VEEGQVPRFFGGAISMVIEICTDTQTMVSDATMAHKQAGTLERVGFG